MSYVLLKKLGIKIEQTKETVNLFHRYKENDYDVKTKDWVSAYSVEVALRQVYNEDPSALKGRKYLKKLEEENRRLKMNINSIKEVLK